MTICISDPNKYEKKFCRSARVPPIFSNYCLVFVMDAARNCSLLRGEIAF